MDVHAVYASLLKQGYSPKDAAKQAQERTGMSAATGKPIRRGFSETKKSFVYGQYRILK